jgi:hypothetical protein
MRFKIHFILFLALCNALQAQDHLLESQSVKDGYVDKISYAPGDTATVYINAVNAVSNFRLFLYDEGKKIADTLYADIFPQVVSNAKPYEEGYGYKPTFKYVIPRVPSGVYRLGSAIGFIIRDSTGSRPITVLLPTNTNAAYNNNGGKSLYSFNSSDSQASRVVSFLRPRKYGQDAELIRWMKARGFHDHQVISDIDMNDTSLFFRSKVLVVQGHSEYWSRQARLNFDRFVKSGKDALILSGNTMWWHVRYSADMSRMICFKNYDLDTVSDPLLRTGEWPNEKLGYSVVKSIGVDYLHGVYLNKYPQGQSSYVVVEPGSPLFEGTGMMAGDSLWTQSYEFDGCPIKGVSPEGIPIPDYKIPGFSRYEFLGFNRGPTPMGPVPGSSKPPTFGMLTVMQRNDHEGRIINMGAHTWSIQGSGMFGSDSTVLGKITQNALEKLLQGKEVFSPNAFYDPNIHVSQSVMKPGSYAYSYIKDGKGFIRFAMASGQKVSVDLIDFKGLVVKNVFRNYAVENMECDIELSEDLLPSGLYLYRIYGEDQVMTGKLVLNGSEFR